MLLNLGNKVLYNEYIKNEYDTTYNTIKLKRRVRCKGTSSELLQLLAETLNNYVECTRYICGYADTGHEVFAVLSILNLINIGKMSYELQEKLQKKDIDATQITVHNVRSLLADYSNNNTLLDTYIQSLNNERNKLVHQVPAIDNLSEVTSKIINVANVKKMALLMHTYTNFFKVTATKMKISSKIINNILLNEEEIVITICRFVTPKSNDSVLIGYNDWLKKSNKSEEGAIYNNIHLNQDFIEQLNNVTKYNKEIQNLQLKIEHLNLETVELLKEKECLQKEVDELKNTCNNFRRESALTCNNNNASLQSKQLLEF